MPYEGPLKPGDAVGVLFINGDLQLGGTGTVTHLDGERVYAFFGRGGGLHCFTVEGTPVWSKDLGRFEGPWGTASSPVLAGDLVLKGLVDALDLVLAAALRLPDLATRGTWDGDQGHDLLVLRTTGSGWTGFLRDDLTTLPETEDRILATIVTARWSYAEGGIDYTAAWHAARDAMRAAQTASPAGATGGSGGTATDAESALTISRGS